MCVHECACVHLYNLVGATGMLKALIIFMESVWLLTRVVLTCQPYYVWLEYIERQGLSLCSQKRSRVGCGRGFDTWEVSRRPICKTEKKNPPSMLLFTASLTAYSSHFIWETSCLAGVHVSQICTLKSTWHHNMSDSATGNIVCGVFTKPVGILRIFSSVRIAMCKPASVTPGCACI